MFAVALVVVAAAGAALGVLMARRGQAKVSGTVVADKTSIGDFHFAVNVCESGAALVPPFLGVGLRGPDGYAMRVADSGDSARIWLYSQGGKHGALQIGKRSCSQWDVIVDWAQVTRNRVNAVNGHLRIACAVGGGKVTADVTFALCAL